MNKITIFTVNLENNGHINTLLHKFCINSWQKLVDYFKELGYETSIKIFDYNSPEVIKFKEDCEIHYNSKSSLAVKADAFRFYILSKYPNHLWLDTDTYVINPKETFNLEKKFFRNSFWCIYNHKDLTFFKQIYDHYKKGEFVEKDDKKVLELLNLKNDIKVPKGLLHLYFIDGSPIRQLYLIDKISDFVLKHKDDKEHYIFMSEQNLHTEKVHYLKEDKELIKFIKENYNLKKEDN